MSVYKERILHEKNITRNTLWLILHLVIAKGCAQFAFSLDDWVGHCNVPEALSLQLPVVRSWGERLQGQHLRPVVEAVGVGGPQPAGFNPLSCAQVRREAQERVGGVLVQADWATYCKVEAESWKEKSETEDVAHSFSIIFLKPHC